MVKWELLDHPQMFSLFKFLVQDFYLNKEEGMEGTSLNCDEFKKKYFGSSFNNDFLLQIMILIYDSIGEMKACIPGYRAPLFPSIVNPPTCTTLKEYIDSSRFPNVENIEITNIDYLSKFVIKSFLKMKKKFPIKDKYEFISFSKKLRKMKIGIDEITLKIDEFAKGDEMFEKFF